MAERDAEKRVLFHGQRGRSQTEGRNWSNWWRGLSACKVNVSVDSFSHPHIRSRLERLMGTSVVRMTDRNYMQKLQERILEDHLEKQRLRIKKREVCIPENLPRSSPKFVSWPLKFNFLSLILSADYVYYISIAHRFIMILSSLSKIPLKIISYFKYWPKIYCLKSFRCLSEYYLIKINFLLQLQHLP